VLDALLQLVEGDEAAVQQRAHGSSYDAARVTIRQPDPEGGFHIGDGLRYGWLAGAPRAGCCLAHAAGPGHGHQDMEIAQLQLTAYSCSLQLMRYS
jgi:hypothetical protein